MATVEIYDTTLRDGAQMEGISFSVEDKLKIARKLDELGIHYIEGGWPGSNPKDAEFFVRARSLHLTHATLAAFGSTRRAKVAVEKDPNILALVDAHTKAVTIVGKSWDLHVTQVLQTELEENLAMIADSVRYLKSKGLTVFFDAEHYFDGFKANPQYALSAISAAAEAGADCLVLCDTNGGALPNEIVSGIAAAKDTTQSALGIHTHNDADLGVANSLIAVQAGVVQVQGTINGYGERCGNADLCSIIPALKLKMDIACISHEQLARLTEISHYISEIANLVPNTHQPYVGASAFTHKGGLHVSGFVREQESYQHIVPDLVGNKSRVLVSELSGRASIAYKIKELGLDLPLTGEQTAALLERVKHLESTGYQFEGAEASFELLVRRAQPGYQPPFAIVDFLALVEKRRRPPASGNYEEVLAEAAVKVQVGNRVMHMVAEGNGPVNALDNALRKALIEFYPSVAAVRLTDYKVRIIDEASGTAAYVRVLIESTDGEETWRTVGSSTNIIEASWLALLDSLEYWLVKRGLKTGD